MRIITTLLGWGDRALCALRPGLRTPGREAERLARQLGPDLRALGRAMHWPGADELDVRAEPGGALQADLRLAYRASSGWMPRDSGLLVAAVERAMTRRGWEVTSRAALSTELRVAGLRCTVFCPTLGDDALSPPSKPLAKLWVRTPPLSRVAVAA